MIKRLGYLPPLVLKTAAIELEENLLASIVDESLEIISDGQKVTDIDASSSSFDWNNNWSWN